MLKLGSDMLRPQIISVEGLCQRLVEVPELFDMLKEILSCPDELRVLSQTEGLILQDGHHMPLLLHGLRRADRLLVVIDDPDRVVVGLCICQHLIYVT